MSLLGIALSHAVLPGVAVGFMLFGLTLPAMALGGMTAGLLLATIAGAVSRFTTLKEDASMAAVYLLALALGVSLLSSHGTQLDLLQILFGSALGADNAGLLLVAGVATATILALACLYRGRVSNLRHADGGGPDDAARNQRPPMARHTSRPVD